MKKIITFIVILFAFSVFAVDQAYNNLKVFGKLTIGDTIRMIDPPGSAYTDFSFSGIEGRALTISNLTGFTIPTGYLTVSSGDINVSSGDINVSDGDINVSDGSVDVHADVTADSIVGKGGRFTASVRTSDSLVSKGGRFTASVKADSVLGNGIRATGDITLASNSKIIQATAPGANIEFSASSLFLNGDTWWNFLKEDKDFILSSITDYYLFKADAGNNRIGIGTESPSVLLDVNGTAKADSLIGKGGRFTASVSIAATASADSVISKGVRVTSDATVTGYTTLGGNNRIKTNIYKYAISAADNTADNCNIAITSVGSLSNVASFTVVGYDVSGALYNNSNQASPNIFFINPSMNSTTNIFCTFGGGYATGDTLIAMVTQIP